MSKHEKQVDELISITKSLMSDMETWPHAMNRGIEIMINSCCVEVYLRASALTFQAMATMTACKNVADPSDVAISKSLVAASKRALDIVSEPRFRVIAMGSDGTIN